MIGNNRKMNSEINVKEILWRFLEQWKAVLLFSIIFALLFTSAKFIKDKKDYIRNSEQIITVENPADVDGSIASILDRLDEQDRKDVENILREKELLDIKEDYVDNSLILKIDPDNCRKIQLQYIVDAEDERDKESLIEAYEGVLSSEASVKSIAKVIDPDLDAKYIQELLLPGERDTLVVRMLVPEEADTAALRDALNEVIMGQKKNLTEKVGKHDLVLISDEVIRFIDIDRAYNQSYGITRLVEARNTYNRNYALLTEQQRASADAILALKTADVSEESAAEINKPKISAKVIAAGFILGAFMYGAVLGLVLLIRRRVISEEDTGYYPGVRTLYSFYDNKDKKGLFQSAAVEKIRRKKQAALTEQVEDCAKVISFACDTEGFNTVTILSPGTLDSDCDKLITEVCDSLTKSGINASKKEVDNAAFEMENRELAASSPVIPVIIEDKTSLDGFNELMNTCSNYKIDVLGTIYYGER